LKEQDEQEKRRFLTSNLSHIGISPREKKKKFVELVVKYRDKRGGV